MYQSPQAFREGLAKGTNSLVCNTLTGLFNSTSKITGSISKGAASLSFDTDYIKQRELSSRSKPQTATEGSVSIHISLQESTNIVTNAHRVLYGFRDFGKGLLEGASGVLLQPIKGAQQEGLAGLAKVSKLFCLYCKVSLFCL
jgi:vacuolar protein sorting-associated protein 13A/C